MSLQVLPANNPHLAEHAAAHLGFASPLAVPVPPTRSRSAPPVHRVASPAAASLTTSSSMAVHRQPSPMSSSVALLGLSPSTAATTVAALRALSLSPRATPSPGSMWQSRFPQSSRHGHSNLGPNHRDFYHQHHHGHGHTLGACRSASFSDSFIWSGHGPRKSISPVHALSSSLPTVFNGHPAAPFLAAASGTHRRVRSDSDSKVTASLQHLNLDSSAAMVAAAVAVTAAAISAASACDEQPLSPTTSPTTAEEDLVFPLDLEGLGISVAAANAPPEVPAPCAAAPLSAPVPQRHRQPATLPRRTASPLAVAPSLARHDSSPAAATLPHTVNREQVTTSDNGTWAPPSITTSAVRSTMKKPPTPRRAVSFPSHFGTVRFFRRNDRPTEVSSLRWSAADEPAEPHCDYTLLTPNWPSSGHLPSMGPARSTAAAAAQPSNPVLSSPRNEWNASSLGGSPAPTCPTTPSDNDDDTCPPVPRLAYFPACAPVARTPCPWDTVVVEGIQLVVGVCPAPLLPRVPCTKTTAKATDRVRVSGTVLVKNVAFEKRVSLRATVDFWRTHTDVDCHYVGPADDAAGFDRFRFDLELTDHLGLMPNVDAHATVYFCVHYEYFVQEVVTGSAGSSPDGGFAGGHVDRSSSVLSRWESAWDNNSGANYEVVVKRREGLRPSLESEIEEGGAITPCASPVPSAGSPPKRSTQGVLLSSVEIAAFNVCSLRERSGCHLAE